MRIGRGYWVWTFAVAEAIVLALFALDLVLDRGADSIGAAWTSFILVTYWLLCCVGVGVVLYTVWLARIGLRRAQCLGNPSS